jgi:hypothetical protein
MKKFPFITNDFLALQHDQKLMLPTSSLIFLCTAKVIFLQLYLTTDDGG